MLAILVILFIFSCRIFPVYGEVCITYSICEVILMASIIKKKKGNSVYYYVVESARIDGKPRIVSQKYLGKAEDILNKIKNKDIIKPYTGKVFDFGLVTAIYDITRKLKIKDIIDSILPKRNQGLSVGTYILIATINRATVPKSKNKMADWFKDTVLRRLIPTPLKNLTSQRFWDHMKYFDKETIRKCENAIVKQMLNLYELDLDTVVYDATNFFNYINTTTDSELSRRGHNKQKRDDLRQVSLALMSTTDFLVPLFYELYNGNTLDHQEFESLTERLAERYKMLSKNSQQITLVLDKGNINKKTIGKLDHSQYGFVCSLSPSHHKDLIDVPETAFVPLSGEYTGEKTYRTGYKAFNNVEGTAIVLDNEELRLGQLQGIIIKSRKISQAIKRIQKKLDKRRNGLITKGKKPTITSITKQINELLSGKYIKQIINYEVNEKDDIPSINFIIDHNKLHNIIKKRLGKTILFTDRNDWPTEKIVAAYRGGGAFEASFHYLKSPDFIRWQPAYHWTDDHIRVHAFYCVLALMCQSLLIKSLHDKDIDMSRTEIMESLSKIDELVHIYPKESKVKDHFTLSKMDKAQTKLYQILKLEKYAPNNLG